MKRSVVLASLALILSAQASAVPLHKTPSRQGVVEPIRIEGTATHPVWPASETQNWAERSARPQARLSSQRDEQESVADSDRALMLAGIAAIGLLLRRRTDY
jgi:hypothetical protein